MRILNKLNIVEKYLITDLIELEKFENGIFEKLYTGRRNDVTRFISFLKLFQEKGLNLIISGEAGIGKTHFISNLMYNKILENNNMYYMNLDYRKLDDESPDGLKIYFIEQMLKYFIEMNEPTNNIDNSNENIAKNLKSIFDHFNFCQSQEGWKHLVIILDDLDYVEEDFWSTITNDFLAYAKSKYCSLIISCRPPLEAALRTDPRTKTFLYDPIQSKNIKLHPVDLSEILIKRLNYIYNNGNAFIRRFMQISLKIENEKIDVKHIPLSIEHLNYIKMFSNGNIREMLYMFKNNLEYAIKNRKNFIYDDFGKIQFGRENILKLYYDKENILCCRIININEQISRKSRNSLYFNLLVAIADRKIIDEDLMDTLEVDLSFKKGDIINAILLLSNNEHRLIHPESIGSEDKKLAIDNRIYRTYKLSARGRFYIENLNDWVEYIQRVGEIKNSYAAHVKMINQFR